MAAKKKKTAKAASRTTKSKPARKSASKKRPAAAAKPKKKAAPRKQATPAASDASPASANGEMHGVRILGDAKRGGTAKKGIVAQLLLSQIDVVKGLNPRGSAGDTTELERSIKAEGILSSLVVRPAKKGGQFELVTGSRRMTALKNLKWTSPVPVIVRTDLEDDDHARAIAIADTETGERHNPVEIGRVILALKKKGWTPSRIANETGMSAKHVHATIKLMDVPEDILKRVEEGTLSAKTGIEIGRIPKSERERIAKQIGPDTPSTEVARIRKELDRQDKAEKVATGKSPKTSKGTDPRRMVVAWRPAREKQLMLQELCHEFVTEWREEGHDNVERAEIRGMIAALLWDRGDLTSCTLPVEDPAEMEDKDQGKKTLKVFDSLIEAAAALHKPEADEDEEEVDEDEDEDDGEE